MKNASGALIAMFATNQDFQQFDLYTLTLTSGYVLRYTNCQFDVVSGGNTWLCSRSPGSVVLEEAAESGPRAHWTSDLNVGTWQFTVMPRLTNPLVGEIGDTIGSLPWLPAVRAGILNEAILQVDRGYLAAWPATPVLSIVPTGTINVFYGRVAELDFGRSSVVINANDPRELLAADQPRNRYTAACRYALYNVGCNLNKADFATTVIVSSVASNSQFATATSGHGDDFYALGDLLFTTGLNAGLRMMIRSWVDAGGAMTLLAPMPFTVSIGDHLTIYPGCDKTQQACAFKFNNLVNFGGFPYVPAAETAV